MGNGQNEPIVAFFVDRAAAKEYQQIRQAQHARRRDPPVLKETRALAIFRLSSHQGPLFVGKSVF